MLAPLGISDTISLTICLVKGWPNPFDKSVEIFFIASNNFCWGKIKFWYKLSFSAIFWWADTTDLFCAIFFTLANCEALRLYLFWKLLSSVSLIAFLVFSLLNKFGNILFNPAPASFCTPIAAGDKTAPAPAPIAILVGVTSPVLANSLTETSVAPTPAPKPANAAPPLPINLPACAALPQGIKRYTGSANIVAVRPPQTALSLSYLPPLAQGNCSRIFCLLASSIFSLSSSKVVGPIALIPATLKRYKSPNNIVSWATPYLNLSIVDGSVSKDSKNPSGT